jgi:hypothetical protein
LSEVSTVEISKNLKTVASKVHLSGTNSSYEVIDSIYQHFIKSFALDDPKNLNKGVKVSKTQYDVLLSSPTGRNKVSIERNGTFHYSAITKEDTIAGDEYTADPSIAPNFVAYTPR